MPNNSIGGAAGFRAALKALRDTVGREAEVQTLMALLMVAEGGEVAQSDIQQELGLGAAATSRNMGLLGMSGYNNGPEQAFVEGRGLVESWENPMDRRRKNVRLTPKGRLAVSKALKHIGG